MAKVSFSGLLASITGKLAGSVFQFSLGGYQIRTRVSPRDPKKQIQQFRRQSFSLLSYLWNTLSPAQLATWNDNAPEGVSGKAFFQQVNMKLATADQVPVLACLGNEPLDAAGLQIHALDPTQFEIRFTLYPGEIQNDEVMVIFATRQLSQGSSFINDSDYVWLVNILEDTIVSPQFSIYTKYVDKFGVPVEGKLIGVKCFYVRVTTSDSSNAETTFANVAPPL